MPLNKGFHWSVQAREKRLRLMKEMTPFNGAVFSKITSALPEVEQVNVQSFLGTKVINYAYPFTSPNAWIRGQPETGTTMISIIGGDSKDMQPIGYFDGAKGALAQQYQAMANRVRQTPGITVPKTVPYRVLTAGDVDMGSNFAQLFLGLKDIYQARGGLSHFLMSSTKAVLDTAMFQIRGPIHHTNRELNDELRFGTVRRVGPTGKPTLPTLVRGTLPSLKIPPTIPPSFPFAKEYSVILDWYGTPKRLIDHRQGNVVDDLGQFVRATNTPANLRALFRWFSLTDETRAEIDETGNFALSTGLTAIDGGRVNIPAGNFAMDIGQRATIRSKLDMELGSLLGFLTATATSGFRVSTPAAGTVEGSLALNLKSLGTISADTPTPLGIQLGTPAATKYPLLVGNPSYLTSLDGWLSAEVALDNLVGAYMDAASAAWSAIGALAAAVDPTGATTALCLTAAAAGAATAVGSEATSAALGDHMATLSPMPGGFVSGKVVAE